MNPVRSTMIDARRHLSIGIWSILLIAMALRVPGVSTLASLGIMLFVSILNTAALFMMNRACDLVEVQRRPAPGSRWQHFTPGIVAFSIPLAWAALLRHGDSPETCIVMVLMAIVPVGATLLWHPVGSSSNEFTSDNFRQSDMSTVQEEGVELAAGAAYEQTEEADNLLRVRFMEPNKEPVREVFLAPAAPLTDVTPSDNVTQWLTRSDSATGEVIKGGFRIEFAVGQRDATIHVSFCPPFPGTPKITTEDLDCADLEIRVAASFPFGARLTVRRTFASKAHTRPDGSRFCRIGFVAVAESVRRAA